MTVTAHLHDDDFKTRVGARMDSDIFNGSVMIHDAAFRFAGEMDKLISEEFADLYAQMEDIPHFCKYFAEAHCIVCGAEVVQDQKAICPYDTTGIDGLGDLVDIDFGPRRQRLESRRRSRKIWNRAKSWARKAWGA